MFLFTTLASTPLTINLAIDTMVDPVVTNPSELTELSSHSVGLRAQPEAPVTSHQPYQTRDCSIPEQYHLEGPDNYEIRAYRMKNMLQRDGLYQYCTNPPLIVMTASEQLGRSSALTTINNDAENAGLQLMKRYKEVHLC